MITFGDLLIPLTAENGKLFALGMVHIFDTKFAAMARAGLAPLSTSSIRQYFKKQHCTPANK